jgi:DeoR family transcriptional regulator, fructose operon transcriptional repressor
MLREERLWRIAQELMQERKVLCNDLAAEFELTLASIRMDLAELEQRGIAKRVYGGAVLAESSNIAKEPRFGERFDLQRAAKEAIGLATAALISDGETIMIDGGTTTVQVIRNLADKQKLTIISAALNDLWKELAPKPNLQIFLTGGFLRAESFSLVGEVAENTLHGFRASKAILGIDGVSIQNGLTTINFMEAGVKKHMIEASQELIIVADHTKLGKVCLIPVAPVDRATKIVTDAGASPEFVSELERRGVQVIIADAGNGKQQTTTTLAE